MQGLTSFLIYRQGKDSQAQEQKGLLPSHNSQSLGGSKPKASKASARDSLDDAEQPWYKNRALVMTLMVTAWMLSIAKYNDELGPIFVSAPIKQVCSAFSATGVNVCVALWVKVRVDPWFISLATLPKGGMRSHG